MSEESNVTLNKSLTSSEEQSSGVATQATVVQNPTGRKVLVQQAFHPSLFLSRPKSAPIGSSSAPSTEDTESRDVPLTPTTAPHPPSWQKVPCSKNKKRKLSTSPSNGTTKTSNRYDGLPLDLTDDTERPTKPPKPPPIILYGIEDLKELTNLLETVVNKEQFSYKIVNKTQLRISTGDIDAYKKLISLVRENGLIGHTFNRKDERCVRIVIKNLHPSTPVNIIREDIEATGNIVTGEIINAKYGPNKNPTSTFFVNLISGPCNKVIKDLKYIYHQSVTIEEPRKKKSVVQCQRCQQYGHTKNYCMRPYRCVKCGQSHKTSECQKRDRSTPALCALCNGPHPANYKGCEVYKEILARKQKNSFPPIANKLVTKTLTTKEPNAEPSFRKPRLSYAETAKSSQMNTTPHNHTDNTHTSGQTNTTLEQIIIKQTEKFDIILQQMSTLMSLITKLVDKLTK